MLFIDDEARDLYHKRPALLQVVCQMLESHFVNNGKQLEIIDTNGDGKAQVAMLHCKQEIPESELQELVDKLNQSFKRTDGKMTCVVEDFDNALLTVFVDSSGNFSHML